MRKKITLLRENNTTLNKVLRRIVFLIFVLLTTVVNAQIWVNTLTSGRPISNAFFVGDQINPSGDWWFNFEIGQVSWNRSEVGIGQNTDGSSGWSWQEAFFYENGVGSNRRVRRDIGSFRFTASGTWYVVGRARANSDDNWTWADEGGWTNNILLTARTDSVSCPYFTVNAIQNPSNPTVTTISSSQINLSWTIWNNRNVMVLRKKSNESWTEPVQGTNYTVSSTIGSAVVVFNGNATSFNSTGLNSSTGYDYKLYSVNNNYYSAGVVVSASTQTANADFFRSKASGDWSTIGSWESSSDNNIWIDASSAPTSSASSVTIQNAHTISVAANLSAGALTINTGGTIQVNPGVQLTLGSSFTNNGSLILQSGIAGTATILTPASISGSGTYNIEQHLTSGRNWYVSSPVSNAQSGVFTANVNNKLWERDAQNNEWDQITATNVTLSPMKGYVVNMASTGVVTFTGGSLNNGNQSIALNSFPAASGKFNLVGNPYASHITWNESLATVANALTTIWYRTHVASSHVFHTFNATSGIGSPGTVTGLIAPMQSFWVRVSDTGSPGTLALTNSNRSHAASANPLKAPAISTNSILRLEVSNGVNADEAVLYFNNNASDSFDAYDSPKMFSNNVAVPEIYTRAGNEQLVINGLNQYYPGLQLAMGFVSGQTDTYSIRASELQNIDSDIRVLLFDKQLNTEFDLTAGDAYSFSSNATNTEERFAVLFKSASGTTDYCAITASGMNLFPNQGHITLNCNAEISPNARFTIYNSSGQLVHVQALSGYQTTTSRNFDAGVYVVKVENGGRTVVLRTIIQ